MNVQHHIRSQETSFIASPKRHLSEVQLLSSVQRKHSCDDISPVAGHIKSRWIKMLQNEQSGALNVFRLCCTDKGQTIILL